MVPPAPDLFDNAFHGEAPDGDYVHGTIFMFVGFTLMCAGSSLDVNENRFDACLSGSAEHAHSMAFDGSFI